MPSSFGTWSSTMTSPIPALNPTSTGSEMKFATNPKRRTAATTRKMPTSNASVAEALDRDPKSPPAPACPRAAAVRMASVVVVLTLSGREVPTTAYTTMGRKAV